MIEISITTNRARLDQVEQTLFDHGALSITLRDAADDPVLEPLPGETPVWPQVVVSGLFGADAEVGSLKQALRSFVNGAKLQIADVEQQDWVRVCMNDLKPLRFGRRLRICPGNQTPDATAVDIRLDPGLAFGTGAHATTALCLEWLDANPPIGRTIIDYGCGSGILAIAAIRLGAHRVHAVDIDPQALLATRDNAARNGIGANQLITCRPDDLPNTPPADILLANILARPLIDLMEEFAKYLKSAGQIVLSGILLNQRAELIAACAHWFDLMLTRDQNGWALVEGARR